ncbi:MAG TPA: hypothetical protein VGS28_02995 [Candidatus Saccharimonadales bacterium]|nr:hypothetical protein [Candidatus Saccharimonadales bacterium]
MSDFLVLGPSDHTKIERFSDIKEYQTWLDELTTVCAKHFERLFFIPDHGVYVDFAKAFLAKAGPKRVVAVLPYRQTWLIDRAHKLGFSETKELNEGSGWTYLNTHFAGMAPYGLFLGYSSGSILELCSSKYLRVFENNPTTFFIDSRAISATLPAEIEEDLADITYFDSASKLDELLHDRL